MRGKRIFAALLAVLMVLTSGVIPARAASNPELPDLSAFLGSKYTQNVKGTYTDYVTCTYSEDLGTGPLEEFLELLQEDRYRLKLTNTSKEYQDSWDKAGTCKDYFFDYTGSDSRITSITTSNGYAYDVRVTLYTYSDKDYNAIVLYREKDFVLKDSGVRLGDKEKNAIPALHDFFGDALRKEAGNGETAYFFEFSSLPSSEIKEFTRALEKLDLTATEQLKVGKSCLQLFHVNETVVITLWWHDADEELEIILHDDALKAAGYSQKTTQVKKPAVNTVTTGDSYALPDFLSMSGTGNFKQDLQFDRYYDYHMVTTTSKKGKDEKVVRAYVNMLVNDYGYKIVDTREDIHKTWGVTQWFLTHPDAKVSNDDYIKSENGKIADVMVKMKEDYDDDKVSITIQFISDLTYGVQTPPDDPDSGHECYTCNRGKCRECGGDNRVEKIMIGEGVIVQDCTAIFCNMGSCTVCGGDGWVD